jgi:drug/metabolite transporter (DMT)-like permease
MPVTALLVSAVALGEALNPLRIAGATLVVVAIVLGATEGGTQRRTFD